MKRRTDIFISYRRKGGLEAAQMLKYKLCNDGYTVFFDIEELHNGSFSEGIYQALEKCTDFILILSPGALDNMANPDANLDNDWMYQEISRAIELHKNIIPVALSGFSFPQNLPAKIQEITHMEYVEQNIYYEAFYSRLRKKFIMSHPVKRYVKCLVAVLLALLVFGCGWGIFNNGKNNVVTGTEYDWLSERVATEADINGKTPKQIRILRNSIYARHGMIFKDENLQKAFESQEWYDGYRKEIPYKDLNNFEVSNIEFLQNHEQKAETSFEIYQISVLIYT